LIENIKKNIVIVIGLFVALIIPAIIIKLLSSPDPTITQYIMKEISLWCNALLIIIIVLKWEKLPVSSIGFKTFSFKTILFGFLGFIMLMSIISIIFMYQKYFGLNTVTKAGIETVRKVPIWLQLLIPIRAAFTEEILFRGYPIERLTNWTKNKFLGAIIPLIIFTFIHLFFWGIGHLPLVFAGGFVLTIIYIWKKDLTINIIAHLFLDLVAIFSVPLN